MTDEQLTKLADLIADRLINHRNNKDVAWHDKSPVTIEDLLEDMPLSFQETQEEHMIGEIARLTTLMMICLLYTSPSPRDKRQSRMPSSA